MAELAKARGVGLTLLIIWIERYVTADICQW